MQALQQSIMLILIKMVSPNSPAYGNTVAFQTPQTSNQLKSKLQPGDVIFSRTNSSLYQSIRRFMGISYDHVAVVISSQQVIHISPPIISKISLDLFINPDREPYIIRPHIDDQERYMSVLHNFLGEKYNVKAIPGVLINELKHKLEHKEHFPFSLANLKYSRVCSDAVLYSLCRGSTAMREGIQNYVDKTRYGMLGYFTPDEVAEFLTSHNSTIIMKSSHRQEYPVINKIIDGSQNLSDMLKNMDLKQWLKKAWEKTGGKKELGKFKMGKGVMQTFEVLAVCLTLGQILGVVVSQKVRYVLLFLNIVLMIGHLKQLRQYLGSLEPKL